jgi:hypothetical protein
MKGGSMKKFILMGTFFLALIGLASISFAGPFLTCDPMAADVYQVEINGQVIADVQPDPTGTYGFKLDLAPLTLQDGTYTARARAGNMWGWSDFSVPFDFTKSVPAKPAGLSINAQ